jgi:Tfp pilus assembly protein PilF
MNSEEQRHAAIQRVLDHYLYTAHTAHLLLRPDHTPIALPTPRPGVQPEPLTERDQALRWFRTEHRTVLATAALAVDQGSDNHTWQLAWALRYYLILQACIEECTDMFRAALHAAQRLTDPGAQGHAHRGLASAHAASGEYDQADLNYQLANEYFAKNHHTEQADVLHNLVWLYSVQHRYADALRMAQLQLELAWEVGDRRRQASALNAVGCCHSLLGDQERANTICQQALKIARLVEDYFYQAQILDSLGCIQHRLGRYQQAISYYHQATAMFRDHTEPYFEAISLLHLADTLAAAGDIRGGEQARRHARTALGSFPDADKIYAKARTTEPLVSGNGTGDCPTDGPVGLSGVTVGEVS